MLTLSTEFIRESEAGTSSPVVLVAITGATPSKFIYGKRRCFGYPNNVLKVTGRTGEIDPLECKQSLGSIEIDFQDSDGLLRDIIRTLRVVGKTVTLKLGFDTGDDATFPEASFASYMAGTVETWSASPGIVRLVISDPRTNFFKGHGGTTIEIPNTDIILNGEPMRFDYEGAAPDCLLKLLQEGGISSALYSAASYVPAASPNTGHLTVYRRFAGRGIGGSEREELSALMDQICRMARAYTLVQEDGLIRYKEFNSAAAAVDRFTEEDITSESVEMEQDLSRIIAAVKISTAWWGEDGGHQVQMRVRDANGATDWGFSDSTAREADHSIVDKFYCDTGTTYNTQAVQIADTTIDVVTASFAGAQSPTYGTSGAVNPNVVDASHPGYIFIRGIRLGGQPNNPGEVVKYTAITKVGPGDTYRLSGLTRGSLGTTARQHATTIGGPGPFVADITAPIRAGQEILKRFREGAAVVKFKSPLHKFGVQLADIVYLEGDVFIRYGLDGLVAGNVIPFEVISKEVDHEAGTIEWIAIEVRTTAITDVWGGGGIFDPRLDRDGGGGLGSIFNPRGSELLGTGGTALGALDPAFLDGELPTIPSPPSLTMTIPWAKASSRFGVVIAPEQSQLFTASKDTYVDIEPYPRGKSRWRFTEVANGAAAPALVNAGDLRAFKVVTSATAVTAVASLRTATLVDGARNIKDLSVLEGKIGPLAVTETKLGPLAVTEGKVGPLAVTEAKIGPQAVTNAKIGLAAVLTPQIGKYVVAPNQIDIGSEPLGSIQPNADFNIQSDATLPPDGWIQVNGTWGTNIELVTSQNYIGDKSIKFPIQADPGVNDYRIESEEFFPVESDQVYQIDMNVNILTGVGVSQPVDTQIDWYTAGLVLISTSTYSPDNGGVSAAWYQRRGFAKAPTTARFAKMKLIQRAYSREVYIDRFAITRAKVGLSCYIGASATKGAGWSKLPFATSSAYVAWDTALAWDTANSRWTCPRDMKVRVSGFFFWSAAVGVGELIAMGVYKNGAHTKYIGYVVASATGDRHVGGTVTMALLKGDYIEPWGYHANAPLLGQNIGAADSDFSIEEIVGG